MAPTEPGRYTSEKRLDCLDGLTFEEWLSRESRSSVGHATVKKDIERKKKRSNSRSFYPKAK